jgi:hypothetical protein
MAFYIDSRMMNAYTFLMARLKYGNSLTFALDITSSYFGVKESELREFYECFNG